MNVLLALVLIIIGIIATFIISHLIYNNILSSKEARKLISIQFILWIVLVILSFVLPIMPADLISALFYRSPDVGPDGLDLGFSMVMYIPIINAILLLAAAPFLLNIKIRRAKAL